VVGVSDAGSKVRFSAHIPKRMSHERCVAILRRLLLRRIFETQRPGRSYAVGVGQGRLVCGLFRDGVELCSGLVDLAGGVTHHGGGAHRLTLAGERFIGLVAEDSAKVGDRGGDFGERRRR
jgi:hypothetical protein